LEFSGVCWNFQEFMRIFIELEVLRCYKNFQKFILAEENSCNKNIKKNYNKIKNSPQIASNAQRVIFGKISKGVFDFCFARISTKVLLCLSKISTKSSNILKWKAGVITLRR
jgi:hypothetical protein